MKTRLLTVFLAIALVSCDSRTPAEYQGTLYFGRGAYLMGLSLSDGSLSVVGHLGDTSIRRLEAMGPDYLLIAESPSVNRLPVSRISWFNLRTGESADLYQGLLARYLAKPDVVVYDDGYDLYAVPRFQGSENRVIYAHPHDPVTHLVEADPGLLLFETGQETGSVIRSWNSATDALSQLDSLSAACRLDGAVWIGSLQRLACRRRSANVSDEDYLLADLDGLVDGRLELPEGKRFEALTFIDSQHVLVLRETRQALMGDRTKHAVWTYDTRTGASGRLADNVDIGTSAVYAGY